MPKKLKRDHRNWLDVALKSNGRFTTPRTTKKKSEKKYLRRLGKLKHALEFFPKADPIRTSIQTDLDEAATEAANGNYGAAYKLIAKAKLRAKAHASKYGDMILKDDIRISADSIETAFNMIKWNADAGVTGLDQLMIKVKKTPKAADQANATDAIAYVAATEMDYRFKLGDLMGYIDQACADIGHHEIPNQFMKVATDIKVVNAKGFGSKINPEVKRLRTLQKSCHSKGGLYWDTTKLKDITQKKRAEFEKLILDFTALDSFQDRDPKTERKDQQTEDARKQLKKGNMTALLKKEKERLDRAKVRMGLDDLIDIGVMLDTGRGTIERAPPLATFDPEDVLGVFDVDGDDPPDLSANISEKQTADFVRLAGTEMEKFVKNALKDADPVTGQMSEEMFDLILQSKDDLARAVGKKLVGYENPDDWSDQHTALFEAMATQMQQAVVENCPNKIEDDLSAIDFKGKLYEFVRELNSGANGIARRYQDAEGNTIVVKTLISKGAGPDGIAKDHDAMAEEMRTHRRALNGNEGVPGDDNILSMEAAAVSPNGNLHMVMEDAQGADLESVGYNLRTMAGSGLIPEAARDLLARDLIAQTARGLMALENRGLVHNDIKPGNMLMMADGTVKIMDFGESRFGDDSGESPSEASVRGTPENFNVSPGWDAPEQKDKGKNVTSKADAYALGRIIEDFSADDTGFGRRALGSIIPQPEPATAMGRLAAGLTSDDPDNRPSLKAVLASSYMDPTPVDSSRDYPPEDVKDLKAAAADFNVQLLGLKVGNTSAGHAQRDIAYAKTEMMKIQMKMKMTGKSASEVKALEGEVSKKAQEISVLETQVAEAMKAKHDKGEEDYQKFIDDESNTITVGSKSKKTLKKVSVKKVLAHKQRILKEIKDIQDAYDKDTKDDTQLDLPKMWVANRKLIKLDKTVKQLDARIAKLRDEKLGADAKYYLAEKKLAEVAGRFGPKGHGYDTRADGGAKVARGPDGKPLDQQPDKDEGRHDAPPRAPKPRPPRRKRPKQAAPPPGSGV